MECLDKIYQSVEEKQGTIIEFIQQIEKDLELEID